MRFLKKVCRHEGGGHLQIMYGIDGRRDLVERQLDHLTGYQGSRPVRVGNGAVGQLQLDVYGEVLETADIWRRNHEMTEGTWRVLRGLVDWVSKNWHLPDSSIWEVRGEVRHYVFSKVMSWVALDRGVRMAEELGLESNTAEWRVAAGRPARRDHGAGLERAAPVLHPGLRRRRARRRGAGHPDGAVPPVEPPAGPRARCARSPGSSPAPTASWCTAIKHPDGLEGEEGAFSICTFWLAQALAMIGERERAERVFRRMLRHANHVGLYSEEIDPADRRVPRQLPPGVHPHRADQLRRGPGPARPKALSRAQRGGALAPAALAPSGRPRAPAFLAGLLRPPSWRRFGRLLGRTPGRLLGRLLGGLLGRLLGRLLGAPSSPPSWRSSWPSSSPPPWPLAFGRLPCGAWRPSWRRSRGAGRPARWSGAAAGVGAARGGSGGRGILRSAADPSSRSRTSPSPYNEARPSSLPPIAGAAQPAAGKARRAPAQE